MYELKKQKLAFFKNIPLTAIYINVTPNAGNFWLLSIFSLRDCLNLHRKLIILDTDLRNT